ncbi:copper resistance protein B [Phenylobacterium sp.]|uniref:copper resistance protein B n=1 Tax=Phenylobacterium sp. TaxID=1871053 RepID=UPI0028115E72|nr:copper resistance protein B [Phenylobacterium sp.]
MSRPVLLALPLLAMASAAHAQDPHANHHAPPTAAPAPKPAHAPAADPHAHHQAPAAAADPHAGHAVGQTGADLPVGSSPAPPPPTDKLADGVWDKAAMDRSRAILAAEHGGMRHWMLRIDQLELRPASGPDGFAWQAEYRYGGDVDRLALKTEGEGETGGHLEAAEVQALWSHAIGPYFDVQAGVRQDFQPRPRRTYAALGFEGLAPYWFELEGALFLSHKGDLSARLEGSYDLRLTNRLILEPSAELSLAAGDDPAVGVGSGLSDVELGLRLRYDLGLREVSPYVGVHYERKFGDTADYARAAGEDVEDTRLVVGLRAFF